MSIIVSNVNSSTRSRDLEDLFGRYGRINSITNISPQTWQITFDDIRDAKDAQADLNDREINDNVIHVSGPGNFVEMTITGVLHLATGGTVKLVPTTVTIPTDVKS